MINTYGRMRTALSAKTPALRLSTRRPDRENGNLLTKDGRDKSRILMSLLQRGVYVWGAFHWSPQLLFLTVLSSPCSREHVDPLCTATIMPAETFGGSSAPHVWTWTVQCSSTHSGGRSQTSHWTHAPRDIRGNSAGWTDNFNFMWDDDQ